MFSKWNDLQEWEREDIKYKAWVVFWALPYVFIIFMIIYTAMRDWVL